MSVQPVGPKAQEKHPGLYKDSKSATHISDGATTPATHGSNHNDSESDVSSVISEAPSTRRGSTDNYTTLGHPTTDNSSSANISPRTPRKKGQLSKLAKKISMTPYKGGGFFRSSSTTSFQKAEDKAKKAQYQDAVKEAHRRDFDRWVLTKKDNSNAKFNDPLLNSEIRLTIFTEFFDAKLKREPIKDEEQIEDHLAYYAISAIKFISGVDQTVTDSVLTEFTNYDLKGKQTMRALCTHGDFFGIQFPWQFAIDNPKADVYNFSTQPVLYTVTGQEYHKSHIGPSNFHVIHGKTNTDLPFSESSFSFCLGYSLFYTLSTADWVPAMKEYHRVLQPQGSLHLFLVDFDVVNCTSPVYSSFLARVRGLLAKRGIDPYPCKHIIGYLKEAGFKNIKYSVLSLKRGLNNQVGNLIDFVIGYCEYLTYEKLASLELDEDELEDYKQLKLEYHQALRDGKLVDEFGDAYCMFVFGRKE